MPCHVWDLDGPALAFDAFAVANRVVEENLVFTTCILTGGSPARSPNKGDPSESRAGFWN
jgi:hypothetical protein